VKKMQTEHRLNAQITTVLKKVGYMYIKTSEKYMAGVSDFLVWRDGIGLALEVKMSRKRMLNKEVKGKLLSHPFSSKQISFLKGFSIIGGGRAWGVICLSDLSRLYPVRWDELPASGNWDAKEFLEKHGNTFVAVHEIEDLMHYMYRGG